MAQEVMELFKKHDAAWTRVDTILERSQDDRTKFFAVQILESLIKSRWKMLPPDHRAGIKTYSISLVIKLTKDPQVFKHHLTLVTRLDEAIVEVSLCILSLASNHSDS